MVFVLLRCDILPIKIDEKRKEKKAKTRRKTTQPKSQQTSQQKRTKESRFSRNRINLEHPASIWSTPHQFGGIIGSNFSFPRRQCAFSCLFLCPIKKIQWPPPHRLSFSSPAARRRQATTWIGRRRSTLSAGSVCRCVSGSSFVARVWLPPCPIVWPT